jgi:hypothetical protein
MGDDSPPYWTYKVIPEPPLDPNFINLCKLFDNSMIDLKDLAEPDSEEAVYTQHVVMRTKDRLYALTNPKGGRLPTEIQNAQDFAVQQMDHYISFLDTGVNWENVINPLCKTKSPEELHLSVKFLDGLLESFRQADKDNEPIIKGIVNKYPILKEYYAEMSTCHEDENHYDKLQTVKKDLVEQQRIIQMKIELVSALKKKHHPLRQSVKPVMKFIRGVEENKKDAMDTEDQPKRKKQKTFTDILNDYFGVTSD